SGERVPEPRYGRAPGRNAARGIGLGGRLEALDRVLEPEGMQERHTPSELLLRSRVARRGEVHAAQLLRLVRGGRSDAEPPDPEGDGRGTHARSSLVLSQCDGALSHGTRRAVPGRAITPWVRRAAPRCVRGRSAQPRAPCPNYRPAGYHAGRAGLSPRDSCAG